MVRIALGIEYDGKDFYGWQQQPRLRTCQSELETALSKIADQPIRVHCAGRTDTGVHASGQVVHFDTNQARNVRAWTFGVNSQLPKDICVRWMKYVDDEFHARFAAVARYYRYIIFNSPNRPSLFHSHVTWQYRQLEHELMQEAAVNLIGEHDFTSYRAISCQSKTAIRHVSDLTVRRCGDLVIVDIKANAFLHHMVRNIVGVLISVGLGKQDPSWTAELLDAKDRSLGAETAPPNGLYLSKVDYPEKFELPNVQVGPLFLTSLGFGTESSVI